MLAQRRNAACEERKRSLKGGMAAWAAGAPRQLTRAGRCPIGSMDRPPRAGRAGYEPVLFTGRRADLDQALESSSFIITARLLTHDKLVVRLRSTRSRVGRDAAIESRDHLRAPTTGTLAHATRGRAIAANHAGRRVGSGVRELKDALTCLEVGESRTQPETSRCRAPTNRPCTPAKSHVGFGKMPGAKRESRSPLDVIREDSVTKCRVSRGR
jgi:hypothetical protein